MLLGLVDFEVGVGRHGVRCRFNVVPRRNTESGRGLGLSAKLVESEEYGVRRSRGGVRSLEY